MDNFVSKTQRPARAPAPAAAPAPAPAPPRCAGKPGFLNPLEDLVRTRSSQAHRSQHIAKVRKREATRATVANPRLFEERHVLQVVTLDGENALPKKLGVCTLCFDLVKIDDTSSCYRHFERTRCVQPRGRELAADLKGVSPRSPVQPDGSSYMSFKDALPGHVGLVIWLVARIRPFQVVDDPEFRDFCHCISGGKYKPCSYRFVIVLIKLIFGMVKKKIKVLLRKVVKQYMGLPPWTVYFDTWTGLNHKGFLGVAASA